MALEIDGEAVAASGPAVRLMAARSGDSTLQVCAEDGSIKALHSLYDPRAEAASIVDRFRFDGSGMLVVLGLGLGYHVAELAERFPGAEIVVVEAHREIFRLHKLHGPQLSERVRCLVGLEPERAVREVTRLQLRSGFAPLAVFSLPPALAAFPCYYGKIRSSLEAAARLRLWDRLKYPRFAGDPVHVGLIDYGYYLTNEVARAAQRSGHSVTRIPIRKGQEGEEAVRILIAQLAECRLDFLLTINHLGFDKAGMLTSFLKSIELPAAVWYVDNPNLIVKAFDANVSPFVSVFVWDRGYMADMRAMGFEQVVYLPLATDEEVFRPLRLSRKEAEQLGADAGFVGNSMVGPARDWLEKVGGRLRPLVEEAAEALSRRRDSLAQVLAAARERAGPAQATAAEWLDFEGAVLWRATLLYRLSCVRQLGRFRHRICGDEGWKSLLGDGFRIHRQLNYYTELPRFYNACKVNLNATSLQMESAVNQRVFDCAACGAFLLTDRRESLDELFEPGRESVSYRDAGEIPDLIRFYLDKPEAAAALVRRARDRVLREHTYAHRLASMIAHMKARYGRTGAAAGVARAAAVDTQYRECHGQ